MQTITQASFAVAESWSSFSRSVISLRLFHSVAIHDTIVRVSVYLIVAVLAVVAAFGFAVAAVVTVLRNNKEGRTERQLLATMQPTTATTFDYDESGAEISAK